MTKAAKIRSTAEKHPGWSTGQIGKACRCRPEYVRVVLRQRTEGGQSDADRRYRRKFVAEKGVWPSTVRYRTDQAFRDEQKARISARYYREKAKREAAHA
jgi:hypothetical protein